MKKEIASCVLAAAMMFGMVGCARDISPKAEDAKRGMTDQQFTQASLTVIDGFGRSFGPYGEEKTGNHFVGIQYFVWLGQESSNMTGVYNITELEKNQPDELWNPASGASPANKFHFYDEPLYGYYNSQDEWVVRRHLELLANAGIDFLFVDATNGNHYPESVPVLLDVVKEFTEKGYNVPKIMFFTNAHSATVVDKIYKAFYASGEYDDIWFKPFGKPMIIGVTENNDGASDALPGSRTYDPIVNEFYLNYFDIRESQWPTRPYKSDAFPWMSWDYPQLVHQHSDVNIINVTPAQHPSAGINYSLMKDVSSRGYDHTTRTLYEDWQRGQNFQSQWQTVFNIQEAGRMGIEMVTLTGWNEWVAIKQVSDVPLEDGHYSFFTDGFNAEYSRDIEMDKSGERADNFYLQLADNIRRYKTNDVALYKWESVSEESEIDWESVSAVYKDFTGDAVARDSIGFTADYHYTDNSNRNDIDTIKVIHDDSNVYMRIETVNPIVLREENEENWMNILIRAGDTDETNSFANFNFLVGRSETDGALSVERSTGGWNWTACGQAQFRVEGNVMFVTVPAAALGLGDGNFRLDFKVADHVTDYTNIMDYYVTGDSAPLGRMAYAYGY